MNALKILENNLIDLKETVETGEKNIKGEIKYNKQKHLEDILQQRKEIPNKYLFFEKLDKNFKEYGLTKEIANYLSFFDTEEIQNKLFESTEINIISLKTATKYHNALQGFMRVRDLHFTYKNENINIIRKKPHSQMYKFPKYIMRFRDATEELIKEYATHDKIDETKLIGSIEKQYSKTCELIDMMRKDLYFPKGYEVVFPAKKMIILARRTTNFIRKRVFNKVFDNKLINFFKEYFYFIIK